MARQTQTITNTPGGSQDNQHGNSSFNLGNFSPRAPIHQTATQEHLFIQQLSQTVKTLKNDKKNMQAAMSSHGRGRAVLPLVS